MFQHEHKPQQKQPVPWDWHFHDTHLIDPSFSEIEEKKLRARYLWHVFKDLFGKLKTMINRQDDKEVYQINKSISKTARIYFDFRKAMFNPLVDKDRHFSASKLYTDVGPTVFELYNKRSSIYIVQDNIEYLHSFPWYNSDDKDKHSIRKLFHEIIFNIQALKGHWGDPGFKDKYGLDFCDLERRCEPLRAIRDTEEWSYYWTNQANDTLKYIQNHIKAACAYGKRGKYLRKFLFKPTQTSLLKMKGLVATIEQHLQDDSLYTNYQFLSDLKLKLKDYEGNRYDHPDSRTLVSREEQEFRLPLKRCQKCNSVWKYKKINATGSVGYKIASPSASTTPDVQQSFAPNFSKMSPAVQQLFASSSAYTAPGVEPSFASSSAYTTPYVRQSFAPHLAQMSPSAQQLIVSSSANTTPYVQTSFAPHLSQMSHSAKQLIASSSAYTTPYGQQSFAPHLSQMSHSAQQLIASSSAYTTPYGQQSFAPHLSQMPPSAQQLIASSSAYTTPYGQPSFAPDLSQMSPSVQQLFASSSAYMTPYVQPSFDSSEASDDSHGSDTATSKGRVYRRSNFHRQHEQHR